MGKTLVLAEKPSVARDIADVLKCKDKKEGYIDGNNYAITWAIGHLISIAEPHEHDEKWSKWTLSSLPIIPDIIQSKVSKQTKKQFDIIKKLMKSSEISDILVATDAGREGVHIFKRIYDIIGCKKPYKYLWASDMTTEGLQKALKSTKSSESKKGMEDSGYCRSESDWLVGMNFSRLFSIKTNEQYSIGRVMTPVLALLVQRKEEIDKFKPQPFWEIESTNEANNIVFKSKWYKLPELKESRFTDESEAINVLKKCRQKNIGKVVDAVSKEGREVAPLPFDLTTLQKEANQKFNFTAQKTLELCQNLYEKHKVLSYPRTDSRYLSEEIFNEIDIHVNALENNWTDFVSIVRDRLSKQNKFTCINNTKITDHHAIIPTGKQAIRSSLSDDEWKIYELVSRRFLAAFCEDAKFVTTTIWIDINSEMFKSNGKAYKERGWQNVDYRNVTKEKNKNDDVEELPFLQKGDMVKIESINNIKKMTKAPPHYSEATILGAMETAGKIVDDKEIADIMKEKGLGTPATRAQIIEKLKNNKYIVVDKKNLIATKLGVDIINNINQQIPILTSPEMTGNWESKLRQMEDGKYSRKIFMQEISNFVKEEIINTKGIVMETKEKALGICPACKKGNIVPNQRGYCCSEHHEGCNFMIWKKIAGYDVKENDVIEIITNGSTSKIHKFKSKEGKDFSAKLIYSEEKKAVSFEFAQTSPDVIGKCPKCGGDVLDKGNKAFGCSKYPDCKFAIWKEISRGKVTATMAKEILKDRKTKSKGTFVAKTGKNFTAYLVLNDDNDISFEF